MDDSFKAKNDLLFEDEDLANNAFINQKSMEDTFEDEDQEGNVVIGEIKDLNE